MTYFDLGLIPRNGLPGPTAMFSRAGNRLTAALGEYWVLVLNREVGVSAAILIQLGLPNAPRIGTGFLVGEVGDIR